MLKLTRKNLSIHQINNYQPKNSNEFFTTCLLFNRLRCLSPEKQNNTRTPSKKCNDSTWSPELLIWQLKCRAIQVLVKLLHININRIQEIDLHHLLESFLNFNTFSFITVSKKMDSQKMSYQAGQAKGQAQVCLLLDLICNLLGVFNFI